MVWRRDVIAEATDDLRDGLSGGIGKVVEDGDAGGPSEGQELAQRPLLNLLVLGSDEDGGDTDEVKFGD